MALPYVGLLCFGERTTRISRTYVAWWVVAHRMEAYDMVTYHELLRYATQAVQYSA